MAFVAFDALADRLREVLEAGAGSLRAITADTYGGNLPDGFSEMGDSVRSVGLPQVECSIEKIRPSASGHSIVGSVLLYDFDVRVRVVRHLPADVQVNGAARDAIKYAAATDADVIRQALSWPGNLTATAGGAATGVLSGMLMHRESELETRPAVEDGAAIVETIHTFFGVIKSAPALS